MGKVIAIANQKGGVGKTTTTVNLGVGLVNEGNNINYFIDRVKDYNPIGRLQTEQESRALREPMLKMLKEYNVDFKLIDGSTKGYDLIVEQIAEKVRNKDSPLLKSPKKKKNFEMER